MEHEMQRRKRQIATRKGRKEGRKKEKERAEKTI
jgi:hypothetical protein